MRWCLSHVLLVLNLPAEPSLIQSQAQVSAKFSLTEPWLPQQVAHAVVGALIPQ